MKFLLPALAAALVFASCQKRISESEPQSLEAETSVQATTANSSCVPFNFVTWNPIVPGQVPPFSYDKKLYPDGRVKSIKMLSRVYPIYSGFKKHAVELIGNFTYSPNRAYLKGTSQVWEYYKTASGTGARRSISKKIVDLKFYMTPQGYCDTIIDFTQPRESSGLEPWVLVIGKTYNSNRDLIKITRRHSEEYQGENYFWIDEKYLYPIFDQYGNIIKFDVNNSLSLNNDHFTVQYDYSIARGSKNYSFIPSQNLVCQEYSLLEVMQWRPQSTHQRKSVSGVFQIPGGKYIEQKQVYKNYKFAANGNLNSVTYGDNVVQRTLWDCK